MVTVVKFGEPKFISNIHFQTWGETILRNFHWPLLLVKINLIDSRQWLVVDQVPITDGFDVLDGKGASESRMTRSCKLQNQ